MAVKALPLLSLDLSPETHHAIEAGCRENSEGRMRPGEAAHCAIMSDVALDEVYLRCSKTTLEIGKLYWLALSVRWSDDDCADIVTRSQDSPEFVHLYVDLAKKSEIGEILTVEPYKHVSTVAIVSDGCSYCGPRFNDGPSLPGKRLELY